MKRFLAILLITALLSACVPSSNVEEPTDTIAPRETAQAAVPTANPMDGAFWAMDQRLLAWATSRDTPLGEWNEQAHARHIAECRIWLQRLTEELDRASLSENLHFAYDNYVQYFEQELDFEGLFIYTEPLDPAEGIQITLKEDLIYFRIETEADIEAYLALLADVPRYLAEILAHEQRRAQQGLFMTQAALEQVLADCRTDLKNTLVETFAAKLAKPDLDEEAYLKRQATLAEGYAKAFAELAAGLSKLKSACRAPGGQSALGAKAVSYYAATLRRESGTNLSPSEAMDLLVEFRQKAFLELETRSLLNGEEFNYNSLRAFDTPQKNIDYLLSLLPEVLPDLPAHDYSWSETPPALRERAPAIFYRGGGGHMLTINPDAQMDVLEYAHESYPGHLYQEAYQSALSDAPLFARVIAPPGYREGWAMNASRLAAERANYFGVSYCLGAHFYEFFILLQCAISGLYVNYFGYDKAQLHQYLQGQGIGHMSGDIYARAVDMPLYDFKFMLGYCEQLQMQELCASAYQADPVAYHKRYLDLGPGYFNLLQPLMRDWAKGFD